MSRRPTLRQSDIDVAAAALEARGLKPRAFDYLPNGGFRFHFDPPADNSADDGDLDGELAEFERKHEG